MSILFLGVILFSTKSTYKELKHKKANDIVFMKRSTKSTYKELKQRTF